MEPEKDTGNVEYKLKLIDRTEQQLEHIACQMRYRCEEGNGECIYNLGVFDDGTIIGITQAEYDETIRALTSAASKSDYTVNLLTKTHVAEDRDIYEILIRESNNNKYIDVKVAIAGQVDQGKTSLLGVLATGKHDNGRGSARLSVFNYKHEVISGRTSSIGHHIIGFDSSGQIVNHNSLDKLSWSDIVKNSRKIVTFFDLAGHSKYLKTTILGLSSTLPDACFILIGAHKGIREDQAAIQNRKFNRIENMTREHIFLCITLRIPFVILITKIDLVKERENMLKETINQVNQLLSLPGIRRIPIRVDTTEDVLTCAKQLYTESIVPIFQVSSVTGQGLDQVQMFLNLLPKTKNTTKNDDVEYLIDSVWSVPGVGTVVGGNLHSGTIKVGDKLFMGPNNGSYEPVYIKSIHCKRVPVQSVDHGCYACLALKKIIRTAVHRGNVILSKTSQLISCLEFTADIKIMRSHSTTIRVGYRPVVHALSFRQAASMIKIENKINTKNPDKSTDDSVLRTGDTATATFKFSDHSEYLPPGTRIVLCEGMTKIVGLVKSVK